MCYLRRKVTEQHALYKDTQTCMITHTQFLEGCTSNSQSLLLRRRPAGHGAGGGGPIRRMPLFTPLTSVFCKCYCFRQEVSISKDLF